LHIQTDALKKIDWYILRSFLSTFFFSVILFTLISTVIDMSEKTDDFTKSQLSAREVFLQYYTGFIPFIISMLFPLFVFISVIFFTSKMANRSEFIAILASGVSLRRVLRPYLVGGLLLAVILWVGNYYIIPKANERRTLFEAKYVKGPMMETISKSIYMRIDSFSYCGIRYYDTIAKGGGSFFMERVVDHKVTYNLRSDNINWDTSKRMWRLTGVVERKVEDLKEDVNYHQELYKNFNFSPKDLQRDEYMKTRLTTPELSRMIELEQLRGSETVKELIMEKAHRTATPVAVVILTLIGAILACRKIRGGSGGHLAMGIRICAVLSSQTDSPLFFTKGDLNPYI
jgi:lipopolysaccharide export system permease protein